MTHEILEHVSEITLRLQAPTWPALLVEAGRVLSARLWAGTVPTYRHAETWRDMRVVSTGRAALLVDWLNELLYHAKAEWWLPVEFVIDEATDQVILARVRGVAVEQAPAAITAATLRGTRATPGIEDGLEANVVLEV